MTLFERNVAALRRRQPELAERVLTCRVGPSLVVQPTPAGAPTLAVAVPGRGTMLLHSARDPIAEARRLASKYEEARTENAVLLGLGLGHHVLAYLEREHDRDFTLIVEPHLDRFRCCLEQTDFSQAIERHKLWFAVGLAPLDVFKMLRAEECSLVQNGIKAFKHPASIALDQAYYAELIARLQDAVHYAVVNNNSREKSWRAYAANMAHNVPAAMSLPGVNRLFRTFDGVPAIIVSAGPSLSKNVHELVHAKGRAVLIAVDTALRVLLDHGVQPDLVVSIDFASHNLRYFDGLDTSSLRLVVDSEVYPPILDRFEGRRFYAEIANKTASRWFSNAIGPHGGLDKGLSVAHTAFQLALEMGCWPVALIGQDLAYTGDLSHAKGTAMARVESRGPGTGNVIPVPDIFGQPVNSHASMVVFLRHFEELFHAGAARLQDGVVDATEGGARIAGTRLMTLKEFILRSCTRPVDVDGILDAAAASAVETDATHVVAEMETMRRELKAVARDARGCRATLNAILHLLDGTRRDPGRLAHLQARYARESAALEAHRAAFELMADGLTRAMTIMRDRRLIVPGGQSDRGDQTRAVRQYITVMDDITDAAEFWVGLLREVRTTITAQATVSA
ncbi:MAG: motility associated factor glycosyltransferase family protein [Verrucomicrobia bacterium]|nr:motility associated factor glycosyltransferase family protein [Verrucomicrobiota bacterium]